MRDGRARRGRTGCLEALAAARQRQPGVLPPTSAGAATSKVSSNTGAGGPGPRRARAARARGRASSSPRRQGAVASRACARAAPGESCSRATASNAPRSAGSAASRSVSPAANAWPPKRDDACRARAWRRGRARRAGGSRRSSGRSRAARRRLPRAKTMAGRWKRSLSREATMPTTPWCHSAGTGTACTASSRRRRRAAARSASASSCIVASMSRRSRFRRSSSAASGAPRRRVGQQAADAERHVGEASGGVEARSGDEAQVEGRGPPRIAPGDREQRGDARLRAAGAQAREALLDEDAVGLVEAHDVGHRAERHQVEEPREVGLGRGRRTRRARAAARACASST